VCLRVLKSEEARASVPQWYRRLWCITTYQAEIKSNPSPNPNPNPTTKQYAIVNIQLNNYSHMYHVFR